MERRTLLEILVVLLLSAITPLIALRHVFLHQGWIFQRDSYPAYYLDRQQTVNAFLVFPAVMDNTYAPLLLLLYFNLITPETFYWFQYLLFPFALAVPSMYWAVRHFIYEIYEKVDFWKMMAISSTTAFLYAVTPTAYYFSHWSNYAGFYAFIPALIAGVDYSLKKRNYLLLALFMSLTTTDPRGFVFAFFIALTYLLVRRDIKTFLLSLPLYFMINLRTFILIFFNIPAYNEVSQGISTVQLWLNYYTFPLLDSLRGLGLFHTFTPALGGNVVITYFLSFALLEFSVLGYIFVKNKFTTYFLALYLFLSFFISSNVVFLGHVINLNPSYAVWEALQNTFLFKYLWIFLPTYISEMVLAPLFLLFSLVAYKINVKTTLLLVFVVTGQLTFSLPNILSGNYQGYYNPIQIPQSYMEVAKFLESHAIGNVINLGFPLLLPNQYFPPVPFIYPKNEGKLLNSLGVQYVVVYAENKSLINYFTAQAFSVAFNNSQYVIFENPNFTYNLTSPFYLLFDYPNANLSPLNTSVNLAPAVVNINSSWVGGYIGNSYADYLVYKAIKSGLKPLTFHLQNLPNPTNFTYSFYETLNNTEIYSFFPGGVISVAKPSSLHLSSIYGDYEVVLAFISYPDEGSFVVGNGTYNLSVSPFGQTSLKFEYLGNMSFSGNLFLYYTGNSPAYLYQVWLIPHNLTFSNHYINVTTVPSSTSLLGRAVPVNGKNYTNEAIILNALSFFLAILAEKGVRERIRKSVGQVRLRIISRNI
ncbi:MAG: hypothetical protein MPF33_00800 [Candidatus Aramenus sp.]|jgi:hypothetical protein|nr:hypothetical protein [Candidatus Aramenus sp.]